MATDTSLHWKLSWDRVLITLLPFPVPPRGRGSSRFQMYTWESSLALTTYFPSELNEAEIWLLIFLKPVNK
jgi:hypothetical protein